jgi:putative phosphoribosyl transferase
MFDDRTTAGRALAESLAQYRGRNDVIVLALPRGGVPVAFEVAQALGAELDVLVVRKLGVPFQPELAMGAIASGGAVYRNMEVLRLAQVSEREFETVLARERTELQRREALYRGARPPLQVNGRIVIVVDDGMATGASLHAGLAAMRMLRPAKLVAAVPVAPPDAVERLAGLADDFICIAAPEDFHAVGQFYRRFDQTSDDEVRDLLARSHEGKAS